ncbi:lysozyme g-like [Gymnodraco acuticeps]|uniref:Lysozyme g n=1 Tax=Gymnodraco acuticeps TaxID=8218 RepID=A0A6P8T6M2_GYMAC|nr:lysozyme g-like [Gymnodraco acuticeps]
MVPQGKQLERIMGTTAKVDVNPDGGAHDPEGDWDSEEHLSQATEILVDFIKIIQNKFPNWSREQQLKGLFAAYNVGDGKVKNYKAVDYYTTHGDYSNDVVARAHWYKEKRDY